MWVYINAFSWLSLMVNTNEVCHIQLVGMVVIMNGG
jgi:hypothetical protein